MDKKVIKPAVVVKDIIDIVIDLANGSASCWGYYQVKEPSEVLQSSKNSD